MTYLSQLGLVLGLCVFPALSQAAGTLYRGTDLSVASLEEITASVQPGSVLVLGEIHDQTAHHENQTLVLEALAQKGARVSVGMEFFERPQQSAVDRYVRGEVSESAFLTEIGWRGLPFDFYRDKVLFPAKVGGATLALNAPRKLTGKISKQGLASLTDEERAMLPPSFELGRAEYYERFKEVMGDHVPAQAIERYFEAQSVWDETMAWTAAEYLRANPEQVLVIIVGDFHVAYGGGLPDRLLKRGVAEVKVISQIVDEADLPPHPRWGQRADWVWVTDLRLASLPK